MEEFFFEKDVDKSFLVDGFSLPLEVVESMRPWFGDIGPGDSVDIKVEFEGYEYPLKVNSLGFDRVKYAERKDIWQVRYVASNPFTVKVNEVFTTSGEYIKVARDLAVEGTRVFVKVPSVYKESMRFFRTDDPRVWKAFAVRSSNNEVVRRRRKFEDWYNKFGTDSKKSTYLRSLAFTSLRLEYYKNNPTAIKVSGAAPKPTVQHLNTAVYPVSTVYEFSRPSEVQVLYEDCIRTNVADDGSLHTAVAYYALWLRLEFRFVWMEIPYFPNDDERIKTLCDNGFNFKEELMKIKRLELGMLAAIRTKPFVLLAGISGTGKSRLVRQLARGFCPTEGTLADDGKPGNFEMIQVRPNWHDSTELMGYVTRITTNQKPKYVLTPFVRFLVKAWLNPEVPFFLCLDEMNLAPVEQYFAEYLSVIETRRHAGEMDAVPGCIKTDDVMSDVLVSLNPEVLEGFLCELSEAFALGRDRSVWAGPQPTEVKKRDRDSLYRQWDEFLAAWPISRLRTITLDEYTKAGSSDTFTYALEAKYSQLGSIWGGSAFKFGIYSRNPNGKMKVYEPNSGQVGNDGYAWYSKYGSTQEAAWSVVKERVVAIAEAANRGDFSAVDKIDLPHVVKWKIAFLYQDRNDIKIVDVYKREWIYLLTADMPPKTSFADRYLKLNEERNGMDVFEWDDTVLTQRKNELLSAGGSSDADDDDEGDEEGNVGALPCSPFIDMIRKDGGIRIPQNLVVIGTVNMDETTFSFSRKVLDRAMSFELNEVNMRDGLEKSTKMPLGAFNHDGSPLQRYIEADEVYPSNKDLCDKVLGYLEAVNEKLDKTPFKIAYRSRNEIMVYCVERTRNASISLEQALDEATSMKILSRIEGDRRRLRVDNTRTLLDVLNETIEAKLQELHGDGELPTHICRDKLEEMKTQLEGGYTSFWTR